MTDKNEEKFLRRRRIQRDMIILNDKKEIYALPKTPVVSLPTFVIKRIDAALKLCLDEGLTLEGAFLCVLGDTDNLSINLAEEINMNMPKMTQEFIDWRDDRYFAGGHVYHIMKIMLALIYNYKSESKVHTDYELSLFNDRKEDQSNG